jgi:hypothetical protein
MRVAGWGDNISGWAEAVRPAKKQPLDWQKTARSRSTPDLLLNLLKLFYIRSNHKSSENSVPMLPGRRPAAGEIISGAESLLSAVNCVS